MTIFRQPYKTPNSILFHNFRPAKCIYTNFKSIIPPLPHNFVITLVFSYESQTNKLNGLENISISTYIIMFYDCKELSTSTPILQFTFHICVVSSSSLSGIQLNDDVFGGWLVEKMTPPTTTKTTTTTTQTTAS